MKAAHLVLAAASVALAAALAFYLSVGNAQRLQATTQSEARAFGLLPRLGGAVEWLNTAPLGPAELQGKVVLVQFWTYSCINWLRTLPHIRAWAAKYKDQGLVVIGVHTPEFDFEKDVANIRNAMSQLKVEHPVAVDSGQAVWRAFANNAWPALYLLDSKGKLRHRHLGEGEYERSERVIQRLLIEAGAKGVPTDLVSVRGTGSQLEADWRNLASPETYVGYSRTHGFVSPGGLAPDRSRDYAVPGRMRLNTWALAGSWNVGAAAATLDGAQGRIAHRFRARDVHLVMGSGVAGQPVRFRILLDGQPPGAAHGADVDADGNGVLLEHRLYQLLRQPRDVQERLFEIEFLDPGAEAFAFTFG